MFNFCTRSSSTQLQKPCHLCGTTPSNQPLSSYSLTPSAHQRQSCLDDFSGISTLTGAEALPLLHFLYVSPATKQAAGRRLGRRLSAEMSKLVVRCGVRDVLMNEKSYVVDLKPHPAQVRVGVIHDIASNHMPTLPIFESWQEYRAFLSFQVTLVRERSTVVGVGKHVTLISHCGGV
ncbi:hypothetical protein BJV78DRAFT_580994 [Lactifluus subvellereus]|nr:hypothetical protein BJV78DRAFT_580994 [Lactifluus subvellereus]